MACASGILTVHRHGNIQIRRRNVAEWSNEMKRGIKCLRRVFPATILGLGACASAPVSPVIPDALKVSATQTLAYVALADGVQIYQCQRRTDPVESYAWVFSAPEARLTDQAGKPFGHHYAGPTWEADDGSKVTGEVNARDPGPDPAAIPWLQLSATSTTGPGRLAKTASILRIRTAGGKAPASGCSEDAVNQVVRVPYSAEYRFYVARP
jgi:Protein of unknown function (DUF3455)